MFYKKKKHKKNRGKRVARYVYDEMEEMTSEELDNYYSRCKRKHKKKKEYRIAGMKPERFNAFCESIPMRNNDISVLSFKYKLK